MNTDDLPIDLSTLLDQWARRPDLQRRELLKFVRHKLKLAEVEARLDEHDKVCTALVAVGEVLCSKNHPCTARSELERQREELKAQKSSWGGGRG